MTKPPAHDTIGTADRIRYLRIATIRQWDILLDKLTDPAFTGTVGIEISAKNGRPGEPRITEVRYGLPE